MIQTKKPTEIFIKTREKLYYLTLSITQACSELVRPLMVVPTTGMGTHINVMVARRGIIKNSRRARLFGYFLEVTEPSKECRKSLR